MRGLIRKFADILAAATQNKKGSNLKGMNYAFLE